MHSLERPVWSALTSRQAHVSLANGGARRFQPAFGMFAAVEDTSERSLASLGEMVREHGDTAVVEAATPPPVPGTRVVSEALCWQMVADGPTRGPPPGFEILTMTDADAAEMLALATLTKPGPFFARTHQLGRFIGVRDKGVLVAMAGERMQPAGFTEVSGVCTLPEHRGRGYAAALMRQVMGAIVARGETPFLHSYAANAGAIRLYEGLGFRFSRELVMTVLTAA
jgi:predicted GNAT family acetyltransferase